MAISYLKGDASLPQGEGPKIIAHVCNDIGRWGKGFVLSLSQRWAAPENAFKTAFSNGRSLALGDVQFIKVASDITVANMVGQHKIATRLTGNSPAPIRYPAIEQCLTTLASYALDKQASIHMPRIGCGLAGGKWEMIEPIIERRLAHLGLAVFVYDYA